MAAQRKIVVKSPLGSDAVVREATVTEQLGHLFEMDIEILSPDESVDFNKVLGQDLTLSVGLDDGSSRHFHGFISRFSQSGRQGRYAKYKVHVVPWLWFLTRTADCRIFQAQNAPDIIKSIFKELGFTDLTDSLTKSYRVRDYCVQYRESDFNFVQRLMEEEGIYYYFTHAEGSHKLVLADSYSGHQAFPGYASIDYFPPTTNETRETDHIHEWQQSRDIQSGKYVVTDYDFTKPRVKLETQYVQKREIAKSDYEVFDYPGCYSVTPEGDHYARARLESLQSQYERMNGEGNARGLACGCLFTLENYPRKDQNKEHLIVSAVHTLHGGDYESGVGAEQDDYTCKFEAACAKEPFRRAIGTRKPRVGGPQTAIVVGPGGEEIFTDKYGRVKVKFHWDRAQPEQPEKHSCWVRVAQIWAGKNWGWMSIPRIGQEVVVDFLEGDPDQPLITGRVYNQDNMPPFDLPANKTQSGVRTRSSLNGSPDNCNEIRFEDKKGAEQLFIHAEKNQDIEVENDETHFVGHDRSKSIVNNETVKVGVDRTESVGKNETIAIGVNRTETVGANEAITIGAHRTISVGATETASVALQRTHNVGVNETISIGAAQEVTIGALQAITVGAAQTINVGLNQSTDVGRNQSLNVGNNRTVDVNDNQTTQIGKNASLKIGDNRTATVGKDDSLKVGKDLVIDAGDSITIKTGSASISMKKDGTITIKGKDISIDGSGKINVKASSDIVMKGSKITQN
jgi:type VI secretion system secreted protein VgrG